MEALFKVFPQSDFTLLGVILALPLIGAFVNGVFGKRLGKQAVTLMALAAVGIPFIAAVVAFVMLKSQQQGDDAARLVWTAWKWLDVSARYDAGQIPIQVAFSLDALSGTMALIVTGVGFLIHLYSTSYMEKDPGYHRFFCYLNLFIFSMLVLILGDSLPVLFVGWEGVGLCSYLLIGFWFSEEANAAAGKKAFITNRIGDFGLLVAMALLVFHVGALDWAGIDGGRQNLLTAVQIWPIGSHVPLANSVSFLAFLNTKVYVSAATLVGLMLFLGCAGKSAQIPLYVWLPDAMAGPTPVSALIHAATMVTAGVYLVCRMASVFVLSPAAMFTVALVGALTAVFAATIAFVQNDIKKVLAYSTVSQLGYMFLGVGVGAFVAGFFHVLTHAFFKACLFLGAGSVIHAMHARIHGTDPSQDMRNMGGLRKYMPITFYTFAAAWLAIIGFPGTAGFFSKESILAGAYGSMIKSPVPTGKIQIFRNAGTVDVFQWPSWGGSVLFALGVVGAIMTAFYMSRLVFGIFWGDFRGWKIVKNFKPKHDEHHDDHHHEEHPPKEKLKGPEPHESPWQMTVPLIVLGGLSIVGGLISAHLLHLHWLDDWLAPVFARATPAVAVAEGGSTAIVLAAGLGAFVIGTGLAYWVYILQRGEPAKSLAEQFPGLHRLVYDKWRIDELYEETVIGAVDSLAEASVLFDKYVVDGIVAKATAFSVRSVGAGLRLVQTGRVQAYAAAMVVGLFALGWFLVAPHARAHTVMATPGSYRIEAAPGFGYSYQWDADGDGKWDTEDFGDNRTVSLNVGFGESKKVRLKVKNAFGRTSEREVEVARDKRDPHRDQQPNQVLEIEHMPDGTIRPRLPGGGRPPTLPPAPGDPRVDQ